METFSIRGLSDLPEAAEILLESIAGKGVNVISFHGEMGAGKTTLIKELCRQKGVTCEVNSPTFSIVNEYVTAAEERIFHFDFYRIKDIEEAFDFGYEEYFYSGNLCLVEWPEKIAELMPEQTIRVLLEITDEDSRKMTIE